MEHLSWAGMSSWQAACTDVAYKSLMHLHAGTHHGLSTKETLPVIQHLFYGFLFVCFAFYIFLNLQKILYVEICLIITLN